MRDAPNNEYFAHLVEALAGLQTVAKLCPLLLNVVCDVSLSQQLQSSLLSDRYKSRLRLIK